MTEANKGKALVVVARVSDIAGNPNRTLTGGPFYRRKCGSCKKPVWLSAMSEAAVAGFEPVLICGQCLAATRMPA